MKPVIFLAFANDKVDYTKYLRNLDAERKGIREVLKNLELSQDLEVIEKVNVSLTEIFDIFQDVRYRDRIVGFHYGGHADGFRLLLNDQDGNQNIDGRGIVSLLAQQQSLKFAFFNGCSTKEYAEKLKNTLPLVISTDSSILDEVAKDLAIRFYKALAENMTIPRAYQQAQAFLTSQYGRDTQNLYAKKRLAEVPKSAPWFLSANPQRQKEAQQWTLKANENALKEGESAADQVNQFLVASVFESLILQKPELEKRQEWQNKDFRLLKEIILRAYPYPMSLGLRILFANTPEMTSFSEIRFRQLLKTYQQSQYFIFTVLLSEMWEIQQKNGFLMLDADTLTEIKDFLGQGETRSAVRVLNQKILEALVFADEGDKLFVQALVRDFLPQLQDENSLLTQACTFLENQSEGILAGEARQTVLDTEKHLSILFKNLAFLIDYKLLIVKDIKTKKNRINQVKHQHSFVYINPINEQLSEDEKEEIDFFVDYNSVLLHKSSKIPKEREYISLTPFLMDTNAFKGVVNVNLFEVAQKMNEEKWIFRNIKNENQNLEVTAHEFYEIKALLDIFVTDCLGG